MRISFKIGVLIAVILVVISCTPIETEEVPTTTSTISIPTGKKSLSPTAPVLTSTPKMLSPTGTTFVPVSATLSTPVVPVSNGTPFPLLYEQITPLTAPSVTLIAHWEVDAALKNLAFMPNYDVICAGNEEIIQSWNIFIGEINSVSNLCGKPFGSGNTGRKVISPDNLYSVEIRSGVLTDEYLAIRNLVKNYEITSKAKGALSVGFSPDGTYMIIGFNDGQVWFIPKDEQDENDGYIPYGFSKPEYVIKVGKAPLQIQASPDGSLLAFLLQDQTIHLWNVPTLSFYSAIQYPALSNSQAKGESKNIPADGLLNTENQGDVTRIAIAPNNLIMATASTDNYIRLWDTQTGKLLAKFRDGNLNNVLVFSPTSRMLASLHNGNTVDIWGIPPVNLEKAKVEATSISNNALSSTPNIAPFPTQTPTPTSSLPTYQSKLPLPWPVSIPTVAQIAGAKKCSIESLARSRYPKVMSYWELEKAFVPQSACDWAVLAFAYQTRSEDQEVIPDEGKRAFFQAVAENPAFAITTSMFYSYFSSINLVEVPPFANQPITSIVIDYEWSGIGEPANIQYHIEIDNTNSSAGGLKPIAQVQPNSLKNNLASSIDPEYIQKIGRSLTDFLPIQSQFSMENCTDNYSDWNISLTFLDGSIQILKTNKSNFMYAGGPWFMELKGQNYIQFSTALTIAVENLLDALGLPIGQPYSMYCDPVDPFDLAFP